MTVHDGVHVGPRFVDRAVDEALEREVALALDAVAFEIVDDDVGRLDVRGCQTSRLQEAIRVARVAHADVTVAVDHRFTEQDPIGKREFSSLIDGKRVLHRPTPFGLRKNLLPVVLTINN